MWISNFSISKPVITTVVMLGLAVFGGIALFNLQTDEFPEVNPPVISVAVPYPGASPSGVEREIVDRMEEAFTAISGVKHITSEAMDGFAVLIVEFVFAKDLQQASQDIRDKISEIRSDLPPEMEEPILTRFDPADLPIISLTLSSEDRSTSDLTRIADPGITSALRAIQGVAEVTVVGGVEREMTVELDPRALEAKGVGVADVVRALQAQNLAAPVGRIESGLEERSIRLRGRLSSPVEFNDLPIAGAGQSLIRLGDVGTARDGAEEPRSQAMYNGAPAVGIDLKKALGYSTTAVSDAVRAKVVELQKTLPKGVTMQIVRDSGVRVGASVSDVQKSLLEGALLTVLVVFVFLRSWRSTVITGLALPLSVLASFVAVRAFGFTLNTMSLLGLSLAIGILIDDAIVVRENIVRHMEMGKDHLTAAREGTSEIGLAVAATTFSIVVVFVPIAFMGGVAQQWFAPFALTIASSVLVSLFVSFSLDPMLSAHWPDPEIEGHNPSAITRIAIRFNEWFDRQAAKHKTLIRWALNHRAAMIAIAVLTFVAALAMPALGLLGSEFFPQQDRSEFIVALEAPPGSSLEYTRRKALEVAELAKKYPEVAYTYATVGGQGGTVDVANIFVRLVPRKDRTKKQRELAEALRADVQRLAGVTSYLATGGFGSQKQIQVQLQGPDIEELNRIAAEVSKHLSEVPGAVDIGLSTKGKKPELDIALDRDLAGSLGVTAGAIAQSLRPAFAGIDAGDWVDPSGETRDVMVRLIPAARTSPADLERLPILIPGPDGRPRAIPLSAVARIQSGLGPAQIDHLDRKRVVTVGANTQGRPLNQVMKELGVHMSSVVFPAGYSVRQGGETESQTEVFGRILVALVVAIMLMYMILVIQFGSFLDPISIMASLPLSLIGVMLALLVTRSTLNLMSLIGVILLMGIVAKNAILLIDFAKWSMKEGKSRKEAIIEASGVRLRPILMTSVAIVAGMLPVAIGTGEGGDFRAPLGRAVIGGVITSTLLTLLVIPTFYDVLAGWRDRVFERVRARRSRRTHRAAQQPTEVT